jgi:hypothetical protein
MFRQRLVKNLFFTNETVRQFQNSKYKGRKRERKPNIQYKFQTQEDHQKV